MKKLIAIVLLIFFASPISASMNVQYKKYKVLMNLCKSMADIPCELKNYSYMYEYANKEQKKEIISKVEKVLDMVNDSNYYDINFKQFKKNYIYLIVKLSKLNFSYDKKLINDVLKEAKFLNLEEEVRSYIEKHYRKEEKVTEFQENYVMGENLIIGLIVPLSGELKKIGDKCLEGILTGINFFYGDNGADIFFFDENRLNDNFPKAKEFFYKNRVNILIGPINRKDQDNAVKIAKELGIPIISLAISNKIYPYKNYFNHSLNFKDEMEQLAAYIKRENLKLGMLYPNSEFGKTLKLDFINFYGLPEIILSYSPDAVDFKSQIIALGNLKKVNPKFNEYEQRRDINSVFIADDIDKALLIIPQLYFYDLNQIRIFGTNFWNSKNIFSLEKKYLKDITFLDIIDYNSKNETFLKFKRYLKKFFNDEIGYMNLMAYDTIKIVEKCKGENIEFSQCMKNIEGFSLLTGKTIFDANGISHKKFKIFRIIDGKLMSY